MFMCVSVCVFEYAQWKFLACSAFATRSAEACDFSKYMTDSLLTNALGINSLKMPDILHDA